MVKLNKVMAGYHMLVILSHVDGKEDASERKVLLKYLQDSMPNRLDIDHEKDVLSHLPKEDYFLHFNNAMNDFYEDSTERERIDFLNFAVKMVMADKKLTKDENKYLKELYFAWEPEFEGV